MTKAADSRARIFINGQEDERKRWISVVLEEADRSSVSKADVCQHQMMGYEHCQYCYRDRILKRMQAK